MAATDFDGTRLRVDARLAPEIRQKLREQTILESSQGVGDWERMKLYCTQLFALAEPDDILLLWEAKKSSIYADGAIEIQLLCGIGVEDTISFLENQEGDEAKRALDRIIEQRELGYFEGFTPDDYMRSCEDYFNSRYETMKDFEEFAKTFAKEVPCIGWLLEKHIAENDEVLLYVLLGDLCLWSVDSVLQQDITVDTAEKECFVQITHFLGQYVLSPEEEFEVSSAIVLGFGEVFLTAVQRAIRAEIYSPEFRKTYSYLKSLCPANLRKEIETMDALYGYSPDRFRRNNPKSTRTMTMLPDFTPDLQMLNPVVGIAFAAICCERLLPNYQAFRDIEKWGKPVRLRKAVDKLWLFINGKKPTQHQLNQISKQIQEIIPDTDDFPSFYASLASYAGLTILASLELCVYYDANVLTEILEYVFSSIDAYVREVNEPDRNPHISSETMDNLTTQSPLWLKEVEFQTKVLRVLRDSYSQEAINHLRDEAVTSGLPLKERGLYLPKRYKPS